MADPANFRRPVKQLNDSVNVAITDVLAKLYAFKLIVTNNSMISVLQAIFEMPNGDEIEVNLNELGKINTLVAGTEAVESHLSKIADKLESLAGFEDAELLSRDAIENCTVGEETIKETNEVRFFNQDLYDATIDHLIDTDIKLPIKKGRDGFYEIDRSRSTESKSTSNKALRTKALKRRAAAKRKASAAAKKK